MKSWKSFCQKASGVPVQRNASGGYIYPQKRYEYPGNDGDNDSVVVYEDVILVAKASLRDDPLEKDDLEETKEISLEKEICFTVHKLNEAFSEGENNS